MCIFQIRLQCMNPGFPRREEYFRLYFGLYLIVMQALSSTICLICSFSSFHIILQQIAQYIKNTQAVPSRIGLFTDYLLLNHNTIDIPLHFLFSLQLIQCEQLKVQTYFKLHCIGVQENGLTSKFHI